jgi:hypothetical protein
MICEQYLIDILNSDNFQVINEMADIYNAERLKEYCNWFFRRHASTFMVLDSINENEHQESNCKDEDD